MRNFLLVLLSLLTLNPTLAQQRVVFEGYVSEEKTSERIPDVVIVNSRSEERIMTDRLGRFRIEARANDTLVFSRPGYGYRYQAARNADSVRVTLPPRNYLLEEVPVTAYKLTSNLPRDIDLNGLSLMNLSLRFSLEEGVVVVVVACPGQGSC